MTAFFNLDKNELNKFSMILDNQGRLVLNVQLITPPHNEPQRCPGFLSPQNSSGESRLDKTSPALSRSSSNSTFNSGDNEAAIATSLLCTSQEFDRETFLIEL